MSGCYTTRDPVKVVIINTQYVETDAMSFKSVVQRLTGKDSKIEIDPSSNYSSASGFYGNNKEDHRHQQQQQQQMTRYGSATGLQMSANVPVMSRGLSFKDFDRLLKELPPLDELFRLCPE
ncbi:VQ motif-containing protein 10-like [Coffea eugenioides]|uniref:VQ motif-containing protein 1-like n=1 Tax=Coffea arabica TaxID=13443 RepID=A0ABM4UF41_COFAR|nr:VQ motif-containing protein 10-like [Coffea arabica]XP_027065047.1 VQ motif-containing protein 10-like [Coffea arabica]XP_027172720.1 VQ motif-containing protein 10-like [Coffea eugenioides]